MGLVGWWCRGAAVLVWDDDRFAYCARFTFLLASVPVHMLILLYILFFATFYHPISKKIHRLRSSLLLCNVCCAVVVMVALAFNQDPVAAAVAMWPRFSCALLAALSFISVGVIAQTDRSALTRRALLGLLSCLLVCGILEGSTRAMQMADGHEITWTSSLIFAMDGLVLLQLLFLVYEETLFRRVAHRRERAASPHWRASQKHLHRSSAPWQAATSSRLGNGGGKAVGGGSHVDREHNGDHDDDDDIDEQAPLLQHVRSINTDSSRSLADPVPSLNGDPRDPSDATRHPGRDSDDDDSDDIDDDSMAAPGNANPSRLSPALGPASWSVAGGSPEHRATLISRLLFSWIWPLVSRAYKAGGLAFADLPPLHPEDDPAALATRFWQLYRPGKSLLWTLHALVWRDIYFSAFLILVSTTASLAVPFFLGVLLDAVSATDPVDVGVLFACGGALFLASLLQSLTEHQFWIVGTRGCLRTQNALMVALFQKTLRLDRRGLAKHGASANLMTVDCARISDSYLIPALHWGTWASFLIVGVALYNLSQLLGVSAFIGFGIFLACWPLGLLFLARVKTASKTVQEKRDKRGALMRQALDAIRVIKSFVWERWVWGQLGALRGEEAGFQAHKQYMGSALSFCINTGQVISPALTLLVYSRIGSEPLTAAMAFSSIAWFALLRRPLALLPWALTSLLDTFVSMTRLEAVFSSPEIADRPLEPPRMVDGARVRVQMTNYTLRWGADLPPVLQNVSVTIPDGAFVTIIGSVGSGKSTMLAALLGELSIEGLFVDGSMSFVGQQPWIQNMTLRDNILFGSDYDEPRYFEVIRACALEADLALLPKGDLTELGEDGVNISGGQRQRVALARAAYAKASILVLDDVLSAVDARVSRHLYDHCLTGFLANRTRIMATHQVEILSRPEVSMIIALSDGGVHVGTYDELVHAGIVGALSRSCSHEEPAAANATATAGPDAKLKSTEGEVPPPMLPAIAEESMARGTVSWAVLKQYAKNFGGAGRWAFFLSLCAGWLGCNVFSTFWLSFWVADSLDRSAIFYADIYTGVVAFMCVLLLFRSLTVATGAVQAASRLHAAMLRGILWARMAFFDRELSGRVANRFIKDMSSIDEAVPAAASSLFSFLLNLTAATVVISYVTPLALVVVALVAYPYYRLAQYYRWAGRDLRRLESVMRSPILAHYNEAVKGAAIVRAFEKQMDFQLKNITLVAKNGHCFMTNWSANQWITVWLENTGNVIMLGCAMLAIWEHDRGALSPGQIGLLLSYAVQVPSLLGWVLKQYAQMEIEFVAVERVLAYSRLDGEPDTTVPSANLTGDLTLANITLTYADGKRALHDFSCQFPAGAKVAIVGRTGAGKSSLLAALMRFYSIEGSLVIGGRDTADLPLAALRQEYTVVPQVPQLFGATLREMLCGPTAARVTDDAIRAMLASLRLRESLPEDFDQPIDQTTLSAGQQQLLCLARALLSPAPFILCDEATAAIDNTTDRIVQQTLREQPRTVLFIMHRLHQLRNFDFVVVVGEGRVLQAGVPAQLLQDAHGPLRQLVDAARETSS